ncbi:MAG: GNAT family N-acetyltransferase [Ilumatobacteraceae bacterium]
MIFDPDLVRRIERSAARVTMATALALADQAPTVAARAVPFGDGALVAFGRGRFVNRAIGASLDELDDAQLDELETFFAACGVDASLEVASWAPAPLLDRLAQRGYTISWFRNVYVASIEDRPLNLHPSMRMREVTDSSVDEWLAVLRAGDGRTSPEAAIVSDDYGRAAHSVDGATDYLADLDGSAVGCGSLIRESGIGWLGAATTLAAYRNRGVQGALVRQRVAEAGTSGCDFAVATAMPAGTSARNLARLGFTLAYCQTVLTKRPTRTT